MSISRTSAYTPSPQDDVLIRKTTRIGIFGNILLTLFKLIAGITGGSAAMISDAIHSSSDVLATGVAYVGVRAARKAPDTEHPYGHERFEAVASLVLAGILAAAAFAIGQSGIESIVSGEWRNAEAPTAIALAAAVISIASKEWMFRYTRRTAQILDSSAFMADAWHHRSDAFSSIGSLVGIAGAMAGIPFLDSAASLVICLFILKTAWDTGREAVTSLTDTSCDSALEEEIRTYICAHPDVSVRMLRSRSSGSRIDLDLVLLVCADLSLRDAHTLSETVRDGITAAFPSVRHVMVHYEPAA